MTSFVAVKDEAPPVENEKVEPGLRMETWKNIKGNRLSNLQADNRFPSKPDEVKILKSFDTGKDRLDYYGARVSGFFRVLYIVMAQ